MEVFITDSVITYTPVSNYNYVSYKDVEIYLNKNANTK